MILSEIKQYLVSCHAVTLNDLSIHFDTDPEALRDMLQIWVRKGKVRRVQTGGGCGSGCGTCACAAVETYQWVQATAVPAIRHAL